MRQIGDGIWVHEDSMKMLGTKLGLRMTVIRLSDGRLWVHSPTAISPALKQQIDELGSVCFLVAANNHHSKWLQDWIEAYPDAEVYVSAGIPRKVPLSNYHILQRGMENEWQDDLEWQTMPSVPLFNETVFFHHRSKSLIVTDLVQNYPENTTHNGLAGAMTKYVFEPIGFKGRCVAPPLKMGFTIKDKPAFYRFIQSVQEWDFDKIIVTHGDIIEDDAQTVFANLSSRFAS
ncbi:DUF4336 domain-containing protein [Photobacterium gaetbulicola]|uniref:Methanol oxidase n=1 Tax=Photobacterium gaetbulicola Gung47 TaxID=658445 RepID=A0A0C5WH14_9GAMM|nr:DUF4336 domain-containing protein [Photobacterium gaetbulicola]AJR06418.1 hypothetical protein H744_1c1396 [Photobacterium gaetbulicola Gung47]PSU05512.1 DUF4336 domain-containing protein [Photobacterium gaetbulicola]